MIPTDLVAQAAPLWEQFVRAWDVIGFLLHYSPYWAPFVLAAGFWHVWIDYVRSKYIAEQEYCLLEIRLPQEVYKSPLAMQAVFDALWQRGGESSFIDRLWSGKTRMWYSLELVSTEGQVHLYIWGRAAFRKLIERAFYAHYPEIEIIEVEDYARAFPMALETHNLFGLDFQLSAPIGVPIKTYTEFGLDQTSAKEEQKVDPMAHILEYLGTMGTGEHVWIQILFRAHKREDLTHGFIRNTKKFEQLAQEEISRIRRSPEETIIFPDGGVGKSLSDRQMKRVQAINRTSLASSHFDVGIRGIYMAEHEHFDGTNIPGLISVWQPFGAPGYNSIVLNSTRWQTIFNYPWQDFNGIRETKKKIKVIDAYRQRSWFHPPYRFRHFMMTGEEMATLFHVPGSVAKTPTINRISSARAQAPSNLPS